MADPSSEQYKRAGESLVEIAGRLDGCRFERKDRVELVVAGFVLRARRLVEAAYMLADAGELAEASPFIRGLMEYTVTLRWLLLDPPKNFTIWAIDDLRNRLVIANGAERLAGINVLEPNMRQRYEEQKSALEDEWREVYGDPVPTRMPSVEIRARDTGNESLYEFAYRFESQTGVHPTAFAIDQMLDDDGEHVRVNAEPVRASYADPYAVAGVALLDILDAAGQAVPSLSFDDDLKPHRDLFHGAHPAYENTARLKRCAGSIPAAST